MGMLAILLAALLAQTADPPVRPEPKRAERLSRWDLPQRRRASDYERMAVEMGGGADTEAAVAASLKALARLQTEDGSWDPPEGGSRVEVTALALLAFDASGHTFWNQDLLPWGFDWRARSRLPGPTGGPSYHGPYRRAYAWLTGLQDAQGFVGDRRRPQALRDHAIAARVLCEIHYSTRMILSREPAEKAIEALLAEPFPSTHDDAEAVAWSVLALRSAALAGVPFDRAALDRVLPNLTEPGTPAPRKAAIDLLLWNFLKGFNRLPEELRRRFPSRDLPSDDLRDWYWGTLALQIWDAPKGPVWRGWNARMKTALLALEDGDAQTLAFRALTLSAYYTPWVFGVR